MKIKNLDFFVAPLDLANFLLLNLDNFLFDPDLTPLLLAQSPKFSVSVIFRWLAKVFNIKISDITILLKPWINL